MSALAGGPRAPQSVVLVPAGGAEGATRRLTPARERPGVRLAAFAALGLYGTIRWASLLKPAPTWRLLGLLAVSVALVWAAGRIARRAPVVLLGCLAVLFVLALSGVPVRWITHVRIAVTVTAIGDGLSAVPRALVPYDGVNAWLRTVIVLGAGILMLWPALMLALAPRPLSGWRRAGAALPLIALAAIPSTLVRPSLPYLQGVILFALVAAFIWGERLRTGESAMAAGLAVVAGAAGMVAAPRLDPGSPWVNYQALAGGLVSAHPEAFDWRQRYGPLHWPRNGREVLDVQAARADYWKAENLDVFDGRSWVDASVNSADAQYTVAPANLARWTQTLQVTLRAIRTDNVIASGVASTPQHIPGSLVVGPSAGTWLAPGVLGPGDSYTVSSYDPHPSPAQLQSAGTNYPGVLLPAYLTLFVPAARRSAPNAPPQPYVPGSGSNAPSMVLFAPFGSTMAEAYGPTTTATPSSVLPGTPYARAYALARQLRRGAATPYDYVQRVQRYLQKGFRYEEATPSNPYPLETFLFKTRAGYCQQFAGAMALLLRMGGIPARVAAGFTTGTSQGSPRQWVVSDTDAHAWVEAWFPQLGWVRFDPTPAAAPARGGHVPLPAIKGTATGSTGPAPSAHGLGQATPVAAKNTGGHGGGINLLAMAAIAAGALLVLLAARATIRWHEPGDEQLLSELEQALRRCGRPIGPATTLAALEQRFGTSSDAAGYIRALRMARFSDAAASPTRSQRRALRAQLRSGLGPLGFARAVWAIPPQLCLAGLVSKSPATGIN